MGRVEMVPLDAIRPDPNNVNLHPDAQLRQIAASIRDFGFNDPIAVDQNGVIVEGHGRLEAARRAGLTEVPILRLTFASVEERRAYAIAHNQTQNNSNMDDRVVLSEFDRIGLDREQYASVGYTRDDIAFMELERLSAEEGPAGGAGAGFAARAASTTDLQFTDTTEMGDWLDLLEWLGDLYPHAMTVADRFKALVADYREAL